MSEALSTTTGRFAIFFNIAFLAIYYYPHRLIFGAQDNDKRAIVTVWLSTFIVWTIAVIIDLRNIRTRRHRKMKPIPGGWDTGSSEMGSTSGVEEDYSEDSDGLGNLGDIENGTHAQPVNLGEILKLTREVRGDTREELRVKQRTKREAIKKWLRYQVFPLEE